MVYSKQVCGCAYCKDGLTRLLLLRNTGNQLPVPPAGRINAVYSNRDVGFSLIKKLNISTVRYTGAHSKLKYYIGFTKQYANEKAVQQFNTVFVNLYDQGVIADILKTYNLEPSELQ